MRLTIFSIIAMFLAIQCSSSFYVTALISEPVMKCIQEISLLAPKTDIFIDELNNSSSNVLSSGFKLFVSSGQVFGQEFKPISACNTTSFASYNIEASKETEAYAQGSRSLIAVLTY